MTELSAAPLLENSGERCIPGETHPLTFYEHVHRYLVALRFADNRDVLDVGSGEGYGTALLASIARAAVGIEIDATVVAHSTKRYGSDRCRFVAGSAVDLEPFAAESFDIVTCFEMIEHLAEQEAMLANIKRVMRPQGLLFVSTPDRLVYGPQEHNPYHVRELDIVEFRDLLASHFAHHALYRQSMSMGSCMHLAGTDPAELTNTIDFIGSRVDISWRADPLEERQFYFAIASDAELPPLPGASHLVDTDFEYRRWAESETREVRAELAAERDRASAAAARAAEWERQVGLARTEAERLRSDGVHWRGEGERWRSEAARWHTEFQTIVGSRSFRIVKQLWRLDRAVRSALDGRTERSGRKVPPA